MTNIPTFQIVTQTSWMRNDMAAAGIELKHSWGIEIPSFSPNDIWWMPQGFAIEMSRALEASGLPCINFTAPGPYLLSETPAKLTGRTVTTLTVAEAKQNPTDGWWKMAEAKNEEFPSEWRTVAQLLGDIEELGLPDSSVLQVSDRILPIKEEYRSYVVDGKAVTTSIYLQHSGNGSQVTVYDGAKANEQILRSVSQFVTTAMVNMTLPRSLTVDTAVLADGSMVILEYNPTWCSAWYDCDLSIVVDAIKVSFEDKSWSYSPDAYMMMKANRRSLLPFAPNF